MKCSTIIVLGGKLMVRKGIVIIFIIFILLFTTIFSTYAENDFQVDIDNEVYFGIGQDRVSALVYINGTNYTNMSWNCLSSVKTIANDVVQVNPPYEKRSNSAIVLFSKEIEDRQFFQLNNNLGTVYWTTDKLVIDGRNYTFAVTCTSENGLKLTSEVPAQVFYESVNAPITRWFWIKENMTGIILGLIITIIIIFFIGYAIRELRGR